MHMNATVAAVTARIVERSQPYRSAYLQRLEAANHQGVQRGALSCTNLAHGFAAFPANDKLKLKQDKSLSVAIVSSYNDMLSAHQPFARFPEIIKDAVRAAGGVAQFAGGVPAMCDGITQGQDGMELSLFSRDAIAMATAVGLSHNMFDAALYLGVCDKIVPGLLIGALHFGHLPAVFVPAGPMTSGMSNAEKVRIRQLYTEGKLSRAELLEAEAKSYHDAGTCTFYGTANSNQMLMEAMGLHMPGAAFITPNTPLRDALTAAAAKQALKLTANGSQYTPVGRLVDEKSIVNAIVALLTTGGSTNHTLHLVAIAKAAGMIVNWDDFSDLSAVVPSITKIYPNGTADVNHFHAAGGTGFVIRELLDAGLMHDDVMTILGNSLYAHCTQPLLDVVDHAGGEENKGIQGVKWEPVPQVSGDDTVLRSAARPFTPDGGLKLLSGNLGRAVIKISAVKPEHRKVHAPALIFDTQEAFMDAFHAGKLDRDFVAILRYQGPRANGMPELHALTPALGILQDKGRHVALVTDGRMSGASGKVPAAIHVTPEVLADGPLGLVREGDMILLDAESGVLEAQVPAAQWARRIAAVADLSVNQVGMGRELFALFRNAVSPAEEGATTFGLPPVIEEVKAAKIKETTQ
jgi:phosphogluconate dehydratase